LSLQEGSKLFRTLRAVSAADLSKLNYLILASLLAASIALALLLSLRPSVEQASYRYTFRLYVFNNGSSPMPLKGFECITVPPNSSRQRVWIVDARWWVNGSASSSYELQETEEGNVEAKLLGVPELLTPSSTFKVELSMHIHVASRERMNLSLTQDASPPTSSIPEELKRSFCSKTSLWDFEDPILSKLLKELKVEGRTTLSTALTFIEWIDQRIAYPQGQEWGLVRYPNQTVMEELGDCDDRANLFIALCRGVGIPCFLQYGIIYEPGKTSNASYFNGRYRHSMSQLSRHGWAVAYVPPWGWLPVDFTFFEGLSLREDKGRLYVEASSPIDHIRGAAVRVRSVIVEGNVTSRDYMASNLKLLSLLEEHNAFLTCEELLEPRPASP
jgi:transglutaminase-like putative cysteine protease